MLRIPDYRYPITYEDCVELESEQLLNAAPQARRVVHYALAQEVQAPGRITYDRVADNQGFPLGPKECNLAGTLSADAYHFERAYLFTMAKFAVKYRSLPFRICGVLGMHIGTSPGAFANPICGTDMISVREENAVHTSADKFAQHFIVRLDWVDT
jgi:hypothetical protein